MCTHVDGCERQVSHASTDSQSTEGEPQLGQEQEHSRSKGTLTHNIHTHFKILNMFAQLCEYSLS